MKSMLFGSVMLALSISMLAQSADETEVKAVHEAFLKAAKAGDGAALEKIFADGLQYSHSNTKLETKREAIDALVKSKGDFEVHSQTIHVYGNTATIRAKVTAHGATGDVPLTMLQVWVKNGGAWQMVERQTTRIPAQ
ncbi:MAG TPA: nuclear transport factor 2 family protein [Bryobacteraceae bacterium]|nr:nuclear transport factor 2 family protein [Bryobacteraceae bacterium]